MGQYGIAANRSEKMLSGTACITNHYKARPLATWTLQRVAILKTLMLHTRGFGITVESAKIGQP